jgi:hypothetical protein
VETLADEISWAGEMGREKSIALGGELTGVGAPTEELPWTNVELESSICMGAADEGSSSRCITTCMESV